MDKRASAEKRSSLALMELKAKALFTFDALGRMVTENERDPERAPRLFLGRTAEGLIWYVRDDLPAAEVSEIADLLASEPPLVDPRPRPASFAALCAALARDAPVGDVWEGPAWHFPATLPLPEGVVALGAHNLDLVRDHFPFAPAYMSSRDPAFAMVADGCAVSICFSTRAGAEAAEAGVETVDAFRGRGYAGKVVATWANGVRAGGRVPLYSTSWDNPASQAVAQKLGLVLYGVQLSIS
jgi:RimJ/RimL family protein N-acetyltransferase